MSDSSQIHHLRSVDAVVFDLDGTLVDTAALHIACSHAAVRAVLGRDVDDETVLRSLGRPLPASVAVLARGAGLTAEAKVDAYVPALVEAFLAYYAAHRIDMVHPFPGVPETLAELRARGYALGLLSNKLRDWGTAELTALGLASYFSCAIFAEDMPAPKPSGAALDPVLAALGVPAGRVLLVGDGAADVACARAAGAVSAAALWGAVDGAAVLALRPDYALQTPADLLALCPAR